MAVIGDKGIVWWLIYLVPHLNGYGVRASIDLTKKANSVGFLVGTYMRWWNIGNSNVVLGGIEPKNETLEVGLRLGLTF